MMKAAEMSGRQPETIKLIAVTKGQPVETIEYAVELGVTRFGETIRKKQLEK